MKEIVNKIENYPIERYTIKENVSKIELKRKNKKFILVYGREYWELYSIHEAFQIIKFLYYSRLKHYIPIYCGKHNWRKEFWKEN